MEIECLAELSKYRQARHWPWELKRALSHLDNLLTSEELVVWDKRHTELMPLHKKVPLTYSVGNAADLDDLKQTHPVYPVFIIEHEDFCVVEIDQAECHNCRLLVAISNADSRIYVFNELLHEMVRRNR